MSVRRAVIEIDDLDGLNVRAFCRQHQISPDTFYRLRREAREQGPDVAVLPGSRAPRTVANKTPVWIEDRIVELRKDLEGFGTYAGPASIHDHLANEMDQPPSEATIWRVLRRRGFITPDPSKAPNQPLQRFTAERANECWQIDDTSWDLSNGDRVKIINIIDDHSRVCVNSTAVPACNSLTVFQAFHQAAARWGLPERFLSDNAPEYRQSLAAAAADLGVGSKHSRPYHPQTCGKVERFHQTLKQFLGQRSAHRIEQLQDHIDDFVEFYNTVRPHRSLDRRSPASVWHTAAKSGPADQPLTTPPSTAVWIPTVIDGIAIIPGNRHVTVGAQYNGQPAVSIVTGTHAHIFINGRLARHVTLAEHLNRYPLHPRPGRPT